jgi:hypothetical protein
MARVDERPMTDLKRTMLIVPIVAAVAAMVAVAPPKQSAPAPTAPPPDALAQGASAKPDAQPASGIAGASAANDAEHSEPAPPLPLELFNCPEDLSILSGAHQTPRLPGQALSAEALAQAIAVARDLDSDLARKLSNLCAEQPAQFEQMIRNSGQRLVAMGELKQRDPQLYGYKLTELRHEMQVRKLSADLGRAMASSDESQARVIEEQLRTVLRLQLALSIKARAEYLCRLEQHIQKVKDEIAREAADFNQTVEKRYQDVLSQASGSAPPATADAAKPVNATTVETVPQPVPAAPR